MQKISRALFAIFSGIFLLPSFLSFSQSTYFHQDFTKTASLINPLPDTSQFSHIILTSPTLSYYKFHKGFMEVARTRQDSATGGIIRMLRATPFTPNPETLFIQLTLSAESVQSNSVNALYLYVGEDFNAVNNSFPGNGIMFGRCAINFLDNAISIKDSESQLTSSPIGPKKKVTLTWVLNNSDEPLKYVSLAGQEETVFPGCYDLWAGAEAITKGSKGYPGTSQYSNTKLSNFEIRFRNGLGKIHIHEILIRDGRKNQKPHEVMVYPNPVSGGSFMIKANNADLNSIRMRDISGKEFLCRKNRKSGGKIEITSVLPLSSGIYIVDFLDEKLERQFVRFLVE